MIDLTLLPSAMAGLKGAIEITSTLVKTNNIVDVNVKAIELQQIIIKLQQDIFSAQDSQRVANEEIQRLSKEISALKSLGQDLTRYKLCSPFTAFEVILQDYNRLHLANCKWYASEHAAFYDGLIKDYKRTQVLADDFKRKVQHEIAMCIDIKYSEVSRLTINWSVKDETVWIGITGIELGDIELLNASTRVHDSVSRALISVFRYHGTFEFLDDIPF